MNLSRNKGSAAHVLIVVIALLAIGGIAFGIIWHNSRKFSPGEVDGNTYINKWANLKVTAEGEFKTLDMKQSIGGGFDSQFVFQKKDNTAVCIVMTHEGGEASIESLEESLKEEFNSNGGLMMLPIPNVGGNVQMSITSDHRMIAGESYSCMVMSMPFLKLTIALREVNDNGVIGIAVATLMDGNEDEVFKMFEQY